MNPSNTQVTPEIKKVIDSNGDGHTVIPTQHSHAQNEVEGLSTTLAGKANAVAAGSPTGGIVIASTSGELSRSDKTVADLVNAIAAKANSSDMTTALAGKADKVPSLNLSLITYASGSPVKWLREKTQGAIEEFISSVWNDGYEEDKPIKMELKIDSQECPFYAQCSCMYHLWSHSGNDEFSFIIVLNGDVFQVDGTVADYQAGTGITLNKDYLSYMSDIYTFQLH